MTTITVNLEDDKAKALEKKATEPVSTPPITMTMTSETPLWAYSLSFRKNMYSPTLIVIDINHYLYKYK